MRTSVIVCAMFAMYLLSQSVPTTVAAPSDAVGTKPFSIEVVDEETGRGVPLVELLTVHGIQYVTDSAGLVAFNEPGLMNQRVFFTVKSHGYEFPKDMFGFNGVALDIKSGGSATIKIKRLNIAERLYRITGAGIYHDSVVLGKPSLIAQPLLNRQVVGQDSTQALIYRGKIWWFWGDTNRAAYPLGNFATTAATSSLPYDGGLDPDRGVDLIYFQNEEGFTRKMIPLPDHGPVWVDGVLTINDDTGRERMVVHFIRVKTLGENLERGIAVFNDEKGIFEKKLDLPIDAPLSPAGHTFVVESGGTRYLYFTSPYPNMRVRAAWAALFDPKQYEGYTPLKPETRFAGTKSELDRSPDGKLLWAWKPPTQPLSSKEQKELIDAGLMKAEESPQWFTDADTGQTMLLHSSSVAWNDFAGKWCMIGLEMQGKTSYLGEVWYAEADQPEGPWLKAKHIVTHDKYAFYNPRQHPFLAKERGRFIYFEGTFANSLSGLTTLVPRYEYNQIMYRLDLKTQRLAVFRTAMASSSTQPSNSAK